jgi:hypothetical protein
MTYSYTQISQYLTCPRRYRHRYLDGWREKDTRAGMLFGRAFERALAAYFLREDAVAVLFREWTACQKHGLHYSKGDTWDRMLQQGIQLLDRFCQEDLIRIRRRAVTCKSSSPGMSRKPMISSPTSTPSGTWMASALCWSGRLLPAATRKNRMDCWRSTHNWFATPG